MQLKGATGENLARATRRRKRIVWFTVSMLLAGGAVGLFFQEPWRLGSLHRAAREAIKMGDYTGASLKAPS